MAKLKGARKKNKTMQERKKQYRRPGVKLVGAFGLDILRF